MEQPKEFNTIQNLKENRTQNCRVRRGEIKDFILIVYEPQRVHTQLSVQQKKKYKHLNPEARVRITVQAWMS